MDLSHWDLYEKFSLHQAACLAAGVDPGLVELVATEKAKVKAISDKIKESYKRAVNWARLFNGKKEDVDAFLLNEVTDIVSEELSRELHLSAFSGNLFDPKDDFYEKATFTREALAEWFSNKSFKSAYEFRNTVFQAEPTNEKSPFIDLSGDRSHVSNKLATLNQAAYYFWANAARDDRSSHPTNIEVEAWLVEHGYSQALAERGATIIRPDWVRLGRKPEK